MILDAKTLVEYFDAGAEGHWSVAGEIEFVAEFEQLVVSPFVIAELEPLVRAKFSFEGWCAVLEELAGGAWTIAVVDAAHLAAMRQQLDTQCVDRNTSADASAAVLAAS
ncbi:VapC toxin family PIN domain ribonuclease [Salinibacterium sp. G-O1]|uniref:VapC toxin family PIN domain ribonuclease n=1 Tax=Salinibacterium sp. G-O1 TaxID=3046208 RepID=UPI0024BA8487|nr:VapC toxin family PIN domain ribonuclease [Salinibacterium sp. G-O1]MDJ0335796.1 VapC toxin family PIN domain ribonuclease [Salinibacterium sp. G-O1]